MREIHCGLFSKDGYLFATNASFGKGENQSAIFRVTGLCGAFVVTATRDLLVRARGILDRCLPDLRDFGESLSARVATTIVASFRREFRKEARSEEAPVPFLLLLVGYADSNLEYIFIRNRVVKMVEKSGRRTYSTEFEIQAPAPVKNFFYGHAELARYLSHLLQPNDSSLERLKLFLAYAITETQKLDSSLFSELRMATLSLSDGFSWVTPEDIRVLLEEETRIEASLSRMLSGFFSPEECPCEHQRRFRKEEASGPFGPTRSPERISGES